MFTTRTVLTSTSQPTNCATYTDVARYPLRSKATSDARVTMVTLVYSASAIANIRSLTGVLRSRCQRERQLDQGNKKCFSSQCHSRFLKEKEVREVGRGSSCIRVPSCLSKDLPIVPSYCAIARGARCHVYYYGECETLGLRLRRCILSTLHSHLFYFVSGVLSTR